MFIRAKLLALLASFFIMNAAYAENGFSVGGVGTFGGEAKSPLSENGWPSLQVYRTFRDCCSYENTAADATLANDALAADNGSNTQITDATCVGAVYTGLSSTCTASGKSCSQIDRDTFQPMRDFDRLNPCIQPSNYSSYSVYKSANARGFGLNSTDVATYNEAGTASAALTLFCPSSNCGTASKTDFIAAKNGLSQFIAKRDAYAASSSATGTLTLADITATYGSSKVTLTAPWNNAPNTTWLVAYLNATENNGSSAMRNANSPADWQTKINALTGSSNTDVALWYIKQISDGVSGYTTAALTSDLLSAAGISSAIHANTTYVTNARSAIVAKPSGEINTTAALTTWLQSLVPPVISPAAPVTVNYNVADVSSAGVQVVASLTATTPVSGGATFSIMPPVAGFAVNATTGRLTTTSSISNGTYTVNVVASDTNAVKSASKVVTVDVNAPPTISLACGNGQTTVAYSCSSTGADADNDALTYSLVGAPSWLSINASGVLSGTPTAAANTTGIKVRVSDGTTTTDSASFGINIIPNTASVLATASSTFTASDVSNLTASGVSSAIANDLNNNNTCGSAGNQSCLAAFNAQKASSSCTLAGGSSATGAQIQAYISCVMIEHHTANVASTTLATPASSQLTVCSSNNTAKAFPLPTTCGHSQWTCSVQSGPSSWSVNNTTNQLIVPASYATAGNVTVTIRMSLGIYSPAYNKDVQKTYSMAQGFDSSKSYHSSNASNVVGAWNVCNNKGGRIMTCAETASDSNLGNKILCYPSNATPAYSVKTYSYNSRYYNTPQVSCGFGSTANKKSTYNNYHNNYSCSNTQSSGWSYGCTGLPTC